MTIEEFKERCRQLHPAGVRFREHGEHGWTSIEFDDKGLKLVHGNPGPHWIDASPMPATQRLIGKFNCQTGEATFFDKT